LSAAFLARWRAGELHFQNVSVNSFEIDPVLLPYLQETLASFANDERYSQSIANTDFIRASVDDRDQNLFSEPAVTYTHAILNPPYKKITNDSPHRAMLRRFGIETVNLYSAFVALAIAQMVSGGQLVAIIPRSFCNGPYYRPFREFILARTAIRRLHLFASRTTAFKDDAVLQENLILHLECGANQEAVSVSTSTDDSFSDLSINVHAFDSIVPPGDAERTIHIPTVSEDQSPSLSPDFCNTLADIGLSVSTGPVVDFRLREHLRDIPSAETVPLLYPGHFPQKTLTWPIAGGKKPNAICRNPTTEKWLYPTGFYCVVRRLSSKEERQRIVAAVVDPEVFGNVPMLGFENHLNVFHDSRMGLPKELAYGLAAFLNTPTVDAAFRRFNGHTQVNATDLRLLRYPSREILCEMGRKCLCSESERMPSVMEPIPA
jgi:adenine-specific DNA-methyltransferase